MFKIWIIGLGLLLFLSCDDQNSSDEAAEETELSERQQAEMEPGDQVDLEGHWNARIDRPDLQGEEAVMSRNTRVSFTFNPDGTVIYATSAAGKDNRRTGNYYVRNDTLYLTGFTEVPDTYFTVEELENGEVRIAGPNTFILTRADE